MPLPDLPPLPRLAERGRQLLARLRGQPAPEAATLAEPDALALVLPHRFHEALAERAIPPRLIENFSIAPLETGSSLFLGREDALARLQAGIAGWRQGRPMLLALTGPAGCGITTLLNQTPRLLEPEDTLVRHDFSTRPTDTGDALALARELFGLKATPTSLEDASARALKVKPRVIALDNGHFLHARRMNGAAGVLAVGALMVATQGRHLWILGCAEQPWRRQCHANQAQHYYDDVIELPQFSRGELASLIGTRLDASGVIIGPDADETVDAASRLPEPLLRAVHRLSDGQPREAFFHLLRALRCDSDSDSVQHTLPQPLDYRPLQELARLELLTLAEIIAHGELTSEEHRAIFRLSAGASNIILHHLHQVHLIRRAPEAGGSNPRHTLQPLHANSIVRRLVQANYLY